MKNKKYKFPKAFDADMVEHPLKGTGWGKHADLGQSRKSIMKIPSHLRVLKNNMNEK